MSAAAMNGTGGTMVFMTTGNKTVADGSFDLPDLNFAGMPLICVHRERDKHYRVYSFGVAIDESPFDFSFPVLMAQIAFITLTSRVVFYLLRRLKQPRIVCDIIAGILLGPHFLGRVIPGFRETFFADREMIISRTLATLGLILYIFINCVKMDPRIVVHPGRKALAVGLCSTFLPMALIGTFAFFLRTSIPASIARGKFLVFMVAALSITNFPVTGDALAELRLLNSELGRIAMSASMVNSGIGWGFLVFFVGMNQSQGGGRKALYALGSLLAMVLVILIGMRRWMAWINRRTPNGRRVAGGHLFGMMMGVVAFGLIGELIGVSYIDGPMVMGLAMPEGSPLAAALVERMELLSREIMLPIFFANAGMFVTPAALVHWRRWVALSLMLVVVYTSKFIGTLLPAVYRCRLPVRDAFILGLIMNFRGLVDLMITYKNMIGSLLDDESYSLLVLSFVAVAAIFTPLVAKLYQPLAQTYPSRRRSIQNLHPGTGLRLLACLHNDDPIPSIISLLETSNPSPATPLSATVLLLTKQSGREYSQLISHTNENGLIDLAGVDRLHHPFISYQQNRKDSVVVRPFTAISPFHSLHQDICALAACEAAAAIIFPLPRKEAVSRRLSDRDQALRSNFQQILDQAPCTVGILLHGGLDAPPPTPLAGGSPEKFSRNVMVLFWGGPDDREALVYGSRMARHPGVRLTVVTFASRRSDDDEIAADGQVMAVFLAENGGNQRVVVQEVVAGDTEETVAVIRSVCREGYDLVLVGRRPGWNSGLDEAVEWRELPELGAVGDMIASGELKAAAAILVLQQKA